MALIFLLILKTTFDDGLAYSSRMLGAYNLPHDYSELQNHTKVKTSSKDENFKDLFRALKKQKATGVLLLDKWITYLKAHPYDADLSFFLED